MKKIVAMLSVFLWSTSLLASAAMSSDSYTILFPNCSKSRSALKVFLQEKGMPLDKQMVAFCKYQHVSGNYVINDFRLEEHSLEWWLASDAAISGDSTLIDWMITRDDCHINMCRELLRQRLGFWDDITYVVTSMKEHRYKKEGLMEKLVLQNTILRQMLKRMELAQCEQALLDT